MKIIADDLSGPEIERFLDEHIQEIRSITPLQSEHALDLDALRQPGITFWSVMDGDTLVGCGAIKALDACHAEVKSMRTTSGAQAERDRVPAARAHHHRGQAQGIHPAELETGATEFFRPARKLYKKFGFGYCEPFAGLPARPQQRVHDKSDFNDLDPQVLTIARPKG